MRRLFASPLSRRGKVCPGTPAGDRGTSLVEFALVAPLLIVLLFAIADFGRAFQTWITLTNSAREGARLGATGVDAATIRNRVRATSGGIALPDSNITVTNAKGATGSSVTVKVAYGLKLITPLGSLVALIGGNNFGTTFNLASTADMRLE